MPDDRQTQVSRWWYGVAIPVVILGLTWMAWATLHLVSEVRGGTPSALVPANQALTGPFLASLIVTVAFVAAVILLVPLFAVSLWLDIRAVRRSDADWSPSQIIYGGVALLHLASIGVPTVQLVTVPAGAWYLYTRYRRVGLWSDRKNDSA